MAMVPTPIRRPTRLQSLRSITTKATSNAISTSVYLRRAVLIVGASLSPEAIN
jgi:hypothetical protein